jgi:membrane dipeptidase
MSDSVSFDLHAHPGHLYREDHSRALDAGDTLDAMNAAGLTGLAFSVPTDAPVIGRRGGRLRVLRQPDAGELHAFARRQVGVIRDLAAKRGMVEIRRPEDLAPGRAGVLIALEGGDFLEGDLDRVEEAYRSGVRSIQLVHYRINELGDIQGEAEKHGGLTAFGRRVIEEQNRLGMIVDVAHMPFSGVKQVAEVSTRPIMLSHGALGRWVRAVSSDHARVVAATGGVIGVWSLRKRYQERGVDAFADEFRRLADVIGVAHVGLGTDMDSHGAMPAFKNYRDIPALREALGNRGFNAGEIDAMMGGNFVRMYQRVAG